MSNVTEHQHEQEHKNVFLNTSIQVLIFLSLVGVILFFSLFSTYPPIHDFFHGLRHALMIIPCH